ncbi:MAG: complement resistance protein TraT [Magnetospirillum sp. WYHS-4]
MNRPRLSLCAAFLLALGLTACVGAPENRLAMVKDPETGLMFGSVVDGSLVTDSSLFRNKKLKVRVRNTSGDTAFDMKSFTRQLEDAYAANGYKPDRSDDFGLMVNFNVKYSGQIQTNLASEFAFLGAAGGGIAGYRSKATAGTAIGVVSGATVGGILGSFITDDTYIIVAEVAFAEIKTPSTREGKTVTFSRSITGHVEDEEDEEIRRQSRGLKKTHRIQVAVYAGGRNVAQAEIAQQVKERFARIVGDII